MLGTKSNTDKDTTDDPGPHWSPSNDLPGVRKVRSRNGAGYKRSHLLDAHFSSRIGD